MQTEEMTSIQRKQNPVFRQRERQHCFVGPCVHRFARLLNGQHVMSQLTQLLDDGEREVFVGT